MKTSTKSLLEVTVSCSLPHLVHTRFTCSVTGDTGKADKGLKTPRAVRSPAGSLPHRGTLPGPSPEFRRRNCRDVTAGLRVPDKQQALKRSLAPGTGVSPVSATDLVTESERSSRLRLSTRHKHSGLPRNTSFQKRVRGLPAQRRRPWGAVRRGVAPGQGPQSAELCVRPQLVSP